MNLKQKIDILCFLVALKEDKNFYKKHKTDLNRCIKILKDEIEHHDDKKKQFKGLKSYVPTIIQLLSEYFNST